MLECLWNNCQVIVSLDGELLAQAPFWTLPVLTLGLSIVAMRITALILEEDQVDDASSRKDAAAK